jgi:hypothetical protein
MEKLALANAEEQGILNDERIFTAGDYYFNKPKEFAMNRCAFYECNKCESPFFGGLIDCE